MRTQTFKRFISLVLVLCMLVGMLGIFPTISFAADTSASGTYAQVGSANSSGIRNLLLYRDFEDGLSIANGCDNDGATVEMVTSGGNSYYRYVGTDSHTYLSYIVGEACPTSGSLVFQFDIMLEDTSTAIGSMVQVNPAIRNSSTDVYLLGTVTRGTATNWGVFNLSTDDEKGYVPKSGCNEAQNNRQLVANTWYTITYVFSGTAMNNSVLVTCYFNGSKVSSTYTDTASSGMDVRPGTIRFGGNTSGATYCIDDIIIYTSASTDPATAAAQTVNGSNGSTGSFFNAYAAPNVNPDAYDGNFFFKVGSLWGLNADSQRIGFAEAPFKYDGQVYIPTSALTAIKGSPAGEAVETVNGISCVNINNISTAYPGYYASYSSMGLIGVSTTQSLFTEGAEITLLPVMQKFLFDNVSTSLTQQDSFSVSDLVSTDHPYLYADQTRFDELAAEYAAGQAGEATDPVLYGYINDRVVAAERLYESYAQVDANGNYTGMNTQVSLTRGHQDYIFEIPFQTTGSGGGYDVGGRQGEAAYQNERILSLAYAYQITKDINYAKLAYQYAIYMGQWEHWGPGHFLNVADASSPYAVAYDWLYDAWAQLESEGATYLYFNGTYTNSVPQFDTRTVSVAAIEEIIFTHSILPGYYSMANNGNAWHNPKLGNSGWGFYTNTNNWNAVCNAGMSVASLALVNVTTAAAGTQLDLTVDGIYNANTAYDASNILTTSKGDNTGTPSVITNGTYQDYCEYLINGGLYYLPRYGLEQYVPDGSYIESNGYWSYGTNNVFELVAALTSATGSHYGLLDAWGLDRTAYYALNTMSSDGIGYNYHDSTDIGPQDTSWYMYLGSDEGLGDKTLAGIRKDLNKKLTKQSASYYDAIYYLDDEEIGAWEYPELQYYMEGIDGYVVRDSWNADEGTLYAAFMGNTNNLGHGQLDSGSFVYYNKGTRWFCDLGTEEYNAEGFWDAGSRYRYYVMGGEGNNNLIITSDSDIIPYGQTLNGFGEMYANGNNEYGAYAIIENSSVYGGLATTAKRGMLMTNDRKTVVIQDEATFPNAVDTAWIGHTLPGIDIRLSVDGTVAYMSDGTNVIRVKLIDKDGKGLTFSVRGTDTDSLLAEGVTFAPDYSINNGGVVQKDISDYKRLVVEAKGVTTLNIAVIIEEVIPGETMNDEQGFGYSFVSMDSWVPGADNRDDGSVDSGDDTPDSVAKVTITTYPQTTPEVDPDTPIIDLFSSSSPLPQAAVTPLAEGDEEPTVEVYTATTFEELANYINSAAAGAEIVVDLYASNTELINLTNPCVINTNGNELLATASGYVANVSENTVTYSEGTITVSWILANGNVVTENYKGSVSASYKGNIASSSTLYEVDNGDGTYSYYTSGNAWSLTENGAAASGTDLIVTSANKTFYQTGISFDGLFVTVSGSTVTGYYTANEFFTSKVFGQKYDRISVTNDFSYDGTGKNDSRYWSYETHLYMNGNTITFTSSDTSDHLFMNNNADFYFYGPGGINSQAESSNMFYNDATSGKNIYVENADLYSVRAVIDLRCNTAIFKNCNITIEKNASAFTVINRNNAATVAPHLIADGCYINMLATTTSTGVATIYMNGKVELTGGTSIVTKTDCVLFNLYNSTVGTVEGFDYANSYQEMYAIIGNVYHKLNTISVNGTNDTSGTTYDMSGRVFYGEGYTFDSSTDTSNLNVMPGLVIAKLDESNLIIKDPADCAEVIWKNGSTTLATEYWYDGSTPSASADIKSQVTVASGNMLSFDSEMVVAGGTYTFTATVIKSFGLKVNMSLHTDFNLNFFIENIGDMTFKIDGETVQPDTTAMSGYYKVSKTDINPATAGKAVVLEVTYGGVTVRKSISPIDYARKYLASGSTDAAANEMIINIVKYIETAYVYVGNHANENVLDYRKVLSLYNEYKDLASVAVVDRQGVDMSNVTDAISGAQLNLKESPRFRFNLKSSYTGDVVINGETYKVTDGTFNGKTFIEICLKAYDMLDSLTITTAKGSATYCLANYYYYEAVQHGALSNLLNALFAYCETASIYNAANQ